MPEAHGERGVVIGAATHSRFVQRVRRRYAAELEQRDSLWLGLGTTPTTAPTADAINALISQQLERGRALASALRVTRQLVLEHLAVLDLEHRADLSVVTGVMTTLAEVSLERALALALADESQRHGTPRDTSGREIELWIVGMGKLGARELNVSSDIDLIYVYEGEGHTDGPAPLSAHEFFSKVVRRLYALIGDTTEDGFVFRVDLALRPNGNSGPAVVSLAMLEEYFQVQGREWERFAWLKSRVVAPKAAVSSGRATALRDLVTPFVYRRYLDYGVFEGLRQLHRRVREEAQRRAAGRPERANDVKLSRGGIREIEFVVQLLLVVRGGQFPEIRTRSTLRALQRLTARGIMKAATSERLAKAYVFLREIEHRIQWLDDQQTHLLPTADADLAWIAHSLGLSCGADACELLDQLGAAREFVAGEFDALLHDGHTAPGGCKGCGSTPLALDSEGLWEKLPPALVERVRTWAQSDRIRALKDETRQRLGRLVQRAGEAVTRGQCSPESALHFLDWLEPLLRRESYLALLVERPTVQNRLLKLLGLARWPMRYLKLHPGVIDELADERLTHERFDRAAFVAELEGRHAAWERSGEASEEALMDTLRRAHHAELFRTLVRDVEGLITVEQVADELSAAADAVLECALSWCWQRLKQRHRPLDADGPRLAVIAYGKLGGKELGYGSDLDLVFLYDDDDEQAPEVYGALARKLITWLTLRTAAGELFEIDTALRPNGNSGLLVTSVTAFEAYQVGRGNNTAWTWEHQALTRARWCAGHRDIGERFERTRRVVLASQREPQALRDEVKAMRAKVRGAHRVPEGAFDIKQSPGGMMDVEFAVQWLVLAHAQRHPELLDNVGNIALLQRAEAHALLPPGIGQAAADAYRALRQAQHRARLDEAPTLVSEDQFQTERDAVSALWRAVFG